VGYDKGERLTMSRKVLKIGVVPCHIFFSLRPPPIQAKIVEATPLFSPNLPPPLPLFMTDPLISMPQEHAKVGLPFLFIYTQIGYEKMDRLHK
jgi:hypothetical protein